MNDKTQYLRWLRSLKSLGKSRVIKRFLVCPKSGRSITFVNSLNLAYFQFILKSEGRLQGSGKKPKSNQKNVGLSPFWALNAPPFNLKYWIFTGT